MTSHEVLVAAKGYLLTHGWQQDDYGEHGGPRCILGALGSACGVPDEALKWEEWPKGLLSAARLIAKKGVGDWNDEPGRTFEEVIAKLDEAILATAPKDTVSLDAELAGVLA